MAFGIDIYRYQTVKDEQAVADAGVEFAYVKGTDGGGPAIVRADTQVNQMKRAGIPVGLYHYAQLSPSPEAQANVLTAEVKRLKAYGLPPALDLESPHVPGARARDFTVRFLQQLRSNGFVHVALYANTSMLNGIGASTIGVPNTIVWAAQYGPNNGKRNPLRYNGPVHIHQYTSVGGVPGIAGAVDLNESLTALPGAYGSGADEMSEQQFNAIMAELAAIKDVTGRLANEFWSSDQAYGQKTVLDRLKDVDDRTAAGTPVTLSNEDRGEIITGITEQMGQSIAVAVNDMADARDRDGDPATGETS